MSPLESLTESHIPTLVPYLILGTDLSVGFSVPAQVRTLRTSAVTVPVRLTDVDNLPSLLLVEEDVLEVVDVFVVDDDVRELTLLEFLHKAVILRLHPGGTVHNEHRDVRFCKHGK